MKFRGDFRNINYIYCRSLLNQPSKFINVDRLTFTNLNLLNDKCLGKTTEIIDNILIPSPLTSKSGLTLIEKLTSTQLRTKKL